MSSLFVLFFGFNNLVPAIQDKSNIEKMIGLYCHKIEKCLVMGIIATESSFNATAIGGDSLGLMQIRVSTADHFNCNKDFVFGLFSPIENIICGCKYLLYQIKRYNHNYTYAIAAYNSGTIKFKNGSLINQKYVDSVMYHKQKCEKQIQGRKRK